MYKTHESAKHQYYFAIDGENLWNRLGIAHKGWISKWLIQATKYNEWREWLLTAFCAIKMAESFRVDDIRPHHFKIYSSGLRTYITIHRLNNNLFLKCPPL